MRILLVALATFLALGATAQASFPGANGTIALGTPQSPYTGEFIDDDLIALVASNQMQPQPTEGGVVRVGIRTGNVRRPANVTWSADGRRLAFDGPATSLGTGHALYVMNADGTGLQQVGRGDRVRYNPAWSPDGKKLVFTQDNGAAGSGDVYTITTTGGVLKRLTTAATWDGEPEWSPDGTRIAYTCRPSGRPQICQITPEGTSRTVTTQALTQLSHVGWPSWSPDSRSIAFHAKLSGRDFGVFRMTRAGTSLRRLRDGVTPAWSPDGRRIAVETYLDGAGGKASAASGPPHGFGDGNFALATMNAADGSEFRYDARGYSSESISLDPGGWQPLR